MFSLSGWELFDIVIMTIATGFIFMDAFKRPGSDDPLKNVEQQSFWPRLWYAAAIVAPAIILHEFGHKLVANLYGLTSTFEAAYIFLAIGVVLKLMRFPFLIIVPAYVVTVGATVSQLTWIAFAGPAVNLLIGGVAWIVMRTAAKSTDAITFWKYTMMINLFLFGFNLIPFPGFDGSKFFAGLISMF